MNQYLFLNCEGWVRFGPFKWVSLTTDGKAFVDDRGQVIANFTGGYWVVPDEKYARYEFCDPLLTPDSRHPYPNSGYNPLIENA